MLVGSFLWAYRVCENQEVQMAGDSGANCCWQKSGLESLLGDGVGRDRGIEARVCTGLICVCVWWIELIVD